MKRLGWLIAATVLVATGAAHADPPTTQECLDANERAIALHARHELRATQRELTTCASPACPSIVSAECGRRLADLANELPTIVLGAKDANGGDLSDVEVSVDGVPFLSRLDGGAVPIDPGSHTFVLTARGLPPVTETLVIHEGEKARSEVVRIALPVPIRRRHDPTWRVVGVSVAALGVAGLALGAVFGSLAAAAWSAQQKDCIATGCPNRAAGQTDHDNALAYGAVSTVGLITGGALVVVGSVLFAFAPTITTRSAGVTASLRF